MLESNISGLFGMGNRDDDDNEREYRNNSSFLNREANRRKHYIESGYKTKKGINVDIDTGEILDFVPKALKNMAYNNRRNYSPRVKMPDLTKLLPFAMYGAIGLVGYKLYKRFIANDASDIVADKQEAGQKAVANLTVDPNKVKADTLKNTSASLNLKGLTENKVHRDSAAAFYNLLNSVFIDDDKIVKAVLQQHIQTFRLVSTAYGIRKLNIYNAFHIGSLFTNEYDFQGTLKDHLSYCLNEASVKKIRPYLEII